MQGQGSRQLSTTERMLAGQRLNSNRLRSQELQEYEPSEEMADDDEAPHSHRPAAPAHLPDMPAPRARSQSLDFGQRKASGQLGTKIARRSLLDMATLMLLLWNMAVGKCIRWGHCFLQLNRVLLVGSRLLKPARVCRPSTAERMQSGQCLASQRLASQELPEAEPGYDLAEDDEPPPEQRRRSIGHPPTVPPDSLYRCLYSSQRAHVYYCAHLGMRPWPHPLCNPLA